MSGIGLSVSIDEKAFREVELTLGRLFSEESQRELLQYMGEDLHNIAKNAFAEEKDPVTGEPWPEWSEAYAAKKGKKGGPGEKKLHRRGDLEGSLWYEVLPGELVIGETMVYARTHYYGAKAGAFGTTKNGRPIPFGDIPPRRSIGIPNGYVEQVLNEPWILELLGVEA